MAKKPNDKPTMTPITADDPEAKSADVVAANLEKLKALFPEAVSEDGVNVDVLNQLIGRTVTDAEEKYGLNWHGKRKARQLALAPSAGTLRPCPEESVDWDATQNLFIEGDNLEVLKLLQKSYANKVKLIYIDPPYNTGKDFIYPDNFRDSIQNYLELTGQVDEEGAKRTSNPEASGRFHTDWLNMIYPRLKVARNLLHPDGLMCISIDETEVANLRKACDEVFGEECFVGQVTVLCNPKGRSQDKYLANCHEYLVMYSRRVLDKGDLNALKSPDEVASDFPLENDKGVYRELELRNTHREFGKHNRPNLYYPLYVSADGSVSTEPNKGANEVLPDWDDGFEGCWTWGLEKAQAEIDDLVGKKVNGSWKVYRKAYASAPGEEPTKQLKSIWAEKRHHTEKGQAAFNALFEAKAKLFQSPKSLDVIMDAMAMTRDKEAVVLDFFAGSATAAHAVMAMNAADGGKRRFVMVQLPEPCDEGSDAKKAGFETIADIAKERIRRAGRAIRDEQPLFDGDNGFRAFTLDTSNIRAWNPDPDDLEGTLHEHTEHLAAGRSETDVLYELLLKLGLDLAVPIETRQVEGKDVHAVGAGTLFACLAESISRDDVEALAQAIIDWHKELAPEGETTIVFRDSGFADDVAKSNLAAILVQAGFDDTRIRSL